MSRQVEFGPRVNVDIAAAVAESLNLFGEVQALEYAELISSSIEDIVNDPFGSRTRPRPTFGPDVRTLHIGRRGRRASHLILYRVRQSDDVTEIARLLHDKMDLRRHVPKNFGTDVDPAT